ncbi:alpha/beta hydrolase [Mycolicibacterium sp. S2-37]|uniref:alpha/beta fold hydrolase n=1 Tax=Mycolicibacterium sp. S2-37 TaxID=2810297 RepID=UPI001A947FB4|nr:alpha/beta hydrolase [Mycolicibacterium sp. S2-37]MBO0679650.1 alpha/beta hydrolase [Mycolicibacterium sp. S2-37]
MTADGGTTTALFTRSGDWLERCLADEQLTVFAREADVGFEVQAGNRRIGFEFVDGRVRPLARTPDFVLVAPDAAWDKFFTAIPAPLHHHFLAMRMRIPGTAVEGSELAFAQHVQLVRRMLELGRETLHGALRRDPDPVIDRSAIHAGYVTVAVGGHPVDLHVAAAGAGPPLVVLHTAGADLRQAHALLADPVLTSRYRVVAFDMPGHGSSERLPGAFGSWSLTTELYGDVILAVIDAVGLERPVLLGASMAGEICLEMAFRAPERFGGVIACEASERVTGRTTGWARHPLVNESLFVPEWVDGLCAPSSPAVCRDAIWWSYSQGGFTTFAGDIDFYSADWDGRDKVAHIDTAVCPVVMMTGEYDYSCTPAMSEATAARIPGAHYWTMPRLGHFPICENPAVFAPHLTEALDKIGARHAG